MTDRLDYYMAKFGLRASLLFLGLSARYEIGAPFYYRDRVLREEWDYKTRSMKRPIIHWASRPNSAMKPINWAAKIIYRASAHFEHVMPKYRRPFNAPLPTFPIWNGTVGRAPRIFETHEKITLLYDRTKRVAA